MVNRTEIITRCRAKVATRLMPLPSTAEINHGVPLFLEPLVAILGSGSSTLEIDQSAGQHGHDLLLNGFTVSQVVRDYGDVCQTITDLALETSAPISTEGDRERRHHLRAGKPAVAFRQSHGPRARTDGVPRP
jgi:hypothetical protein